MLDVFGRPEMSREEIESAVEVTANRASISLDLAGDDLLLNGPIQGGLHEDLRALAGQLMGEVNGDQKETTNLSETKISISKLRPSPIQPRRIFEKASIAELADSIKSKGLVQPILVRPSQSNPGEYEIIAGERRWRASQIAKLHEIPVVVKNLSDTEVLEVALIENLQRSDLPLEHS